MGGPHFRLFSQGNADRKIGDRKMATQINCNVGTIAGTVAMGTVPGNPFQYGHIGFVAGLRLVPQKIANVVYDY
jgi:hypothetical protein